MSISKRPLAKRGGDEVSDAIIDRAPDARKPDAPTSSRKQAISLTLPPELIGRIDDTAKRLSLSRAAAIALACTKWVEAEQR